jgi:hypothetical protein
MIAVLITIVVVFALLAIREDLIRLLLEWGIRRRSRVGERAFTAYVIPDYLTGKPYITRFQFPRLFGFRPMLHHIHRADHDRHLHDHPWSWCFSIILVGSYEEERMTCTRYTGPNLRAGKVRTRRVRFWNRLTTLDFHRITKLHGEVFTLFVAGPRVPSDQWGFLTPRGWVESNEYIAEQKKILALAYRRARR